MLCLAEARRRQEQKTHLCPQYFAYKDVSSLPRTKLCSGSGVTPISLNFQLMFFGVLVVNLAPTPIMA